MCNENINNNKAIFDNYADTYLDGHQKAISSSGYSSEYFYINKINEINRQYSKLKLTTPKTILDFGCGVGSFIPYIKNNFPDAVLFGVDNSEESIKIAISKNELANVSYAVFDIFNDDKFSFSTGFDLVIVAGVFHHIQKIKHLEVLKCIMEHMNPGGVMFIFEHNPYNPATRLVYKKWDKAFDDYANLIYPRYLKKIVKESNLYILSRNFTVFFPKFLSVFLPLEKYFYRIPFGASYYIIAKNSNHDTDRIYEI